jgi:hypothetical protein
MWECVSKPSRCRLELGEDLNHGFDAGDPALYHLGGRVRVNDADGPQDNFLHASDESRPL